MTPKPPPGLPSFEAPPQLPPSTLPLNGTPAPVLPTQTPDTEASQATEPTPAPAPARRARLRMPKMDAGELARLATSTTGDRIPLQRPRAAGDDETTPAPTRPLSVVPDPPARELPKIDARLATKAGIVLVGLIALGVAGAVRRTSRGQKTLRRPSTAEAQAIAAPLANIAKRRVPKTDGAEDLLDICAAIIAAGDYIDAGELIIPVTPSRGIMPQFIPEEN